MRHEPTHRVLSVVEALAADGPPLPLSEIAREAEASRSTLHAVLAEMRAQGWAEKVAGGWRAGPRLRAVGALLADPQLGQRPEEQRAKLMHACESYLDNSTRWASDRQRHITQTSMQAGNVELF